MNQTPKKRRWLPQPLNMKKKKEHWSASPDEFRETVETEFRFLCDQFQYKLLWNAENPFEAIFTYRGTEIRVIGISYGFGAMASMVSDGDEIPFWTLTTKMNKRFTPSTNKPQLDDLREYAYRLKNECQDILRGDFSRVKEAQRIIEEQRRELDEKRKADVKGMFFSKADKLWKNKNFRELKLVLSDSPYNLSEVWQKRFEYSKKHV